MVFSPPAMTKRRLIQLVLALCVGVALAGFLLTRPAPTVVWLGTLEQSFTNRPGGFSKLTGWIEMQISRWAPMLRRTRPNVEVAVSMREASSSMLAWLAQATSPVTNGARASAWVLSPEAFAEFKRQRSPRPDPFNFYLSTSARRSRSEYILYPKAGAETVVVESRYGFEELSSRSRYFNAPDEFLKLHFIAHPQTDEITLHVGATLTGSRWLAPRVAPPGSRSNFSIALSARVPDGGGLLVCPPATGSAGEERFLFFVAPRRVDANLHPLKPLPKPARP
ncbi:MAG: hypothetical protein HY301_09125 [Verrucomicrobia bacterium]|nr:hypothetical protein [Verrucomicrobiota bacterium]